MRIISNTHPELEFQRQVRCLVGGVVAWETELGTTSPSAVSLGK